MNTPSCRACKHRRCDSCVPVDYLPPYVRPPSPVNQSEFFWKNMLILSKACRTDRDLQGCCEWNIYLFGIEIFLFNFRAIWLSYLKPGEKGHLLDIALNNKMLRALLVRFSTLRNSFIFDIFIFFNFLSKIDTKTTMSEDASESSTSQFQYREKQEMAFNPKLPWLCCHISRFGFEVRPPPFSGIIPFYELT